MSTRIQTFLLTSVLLSSAFFSSCSCGDDTKDPFARTNTFEVCDSAGFNTSRGLAYAKICIDEPSGLTPLCKTNFIMWLSMALDQQIEDGSEPDMASIASRFVKTAAEKNKKIFLVKGNEFDPNHIKELYTITTIRKIYEDSDYITFVIDEHSFIGESNKRHSSVGYTFNKTDYSLADLIQPSDEINIRKQITEELTKILLKPGDNRKLADILFSSDEVLKDGMVSLPANGAYLDGDSLVFVYQEYEIAPYKYGMPCVRLPFVRRQKK